MDERRHGVVIVKSSETYRPPVMGFGFGRAIVNFVRPEKAKYGAALGSSS